MENHNRNKNRSDRRNQIRKARPARRRAGFLTYENRLGDWSFNGTNTMGEPIWYNIIDDYMLIRNMN